MLRSPDVMLAVEVGISGEQPRQSAIAQVPVNGVHHLLPFAQRLEAPAPAGSALRFRRTVFCEVHRATGSGVIAPQRLAGPHCELRHARLLAAQELTGVVFGLHPHQTSSADRLRHRCCISVRNYALASCIELVIWNCREENLGSANDITLGCAPPEMLRARLQCTCHRICRTPPRCVVTALQI